VVQGVGQYCKPQYCKKKKKEKRKELQNQHFVIPHEIMDNHQELLNSPRANNTLSVCGLTQNHQPTNQPTNQCESVQASRSN
jgi:hypothetical protein